MDLLHAAQSGDILTRITTDESGMALLDNLQFLGEGQAILSGVSLIDDISANPNKINNISLDHIFSHRGNGLGLTRFDANGDISVIGTIGNISLSVHKVTEEDVDARNVGIELAMWGIGVPFNELVGLVLAATTGLFNRRMSDLPGLTVGDNELRIATFNPGGSPDDYYGAPMTPGVSSGYEYTFRNGQAISNGGYYYTVYIPHRHF